MAVLRIRNQKCPKSAYMRRREVSLRQHGFLVPRIYACGTVIKINATDYKHGQTLSRML